LAFLLETGCLLLVTCRAFPGLFITPQLRAIFASHWFPIGLFIAMPLAFSLALRNFVLRPNRTLSFVAVDVTLLASLIGGLVSVPTSEQGVFFGLDFFVLNVVFTGLLFIPMERMFPCYSYQRLFRNEWREDLFYYFANSMFVQVLTYLATAPANFISVHTQFSALRETVGAQPLALQVIEIIFFTDLVKYWLHRVPALWRFHAVHHSAKSMDWIAGARMHFLEIIILRGVTAIPMFSFRFDPFAIQICLLIVYVYSAFIHANVGWNLERIGSFFVTPRFHHWHHGIEREATDVNFAIHFTWLDRMFGTLYLPIGKWPDGYGVGSHPVPSGYWQQFLYPFKR
jgi:sterol desaturase/sphingolipid hydroxylase (fatty acid hydroxylase superfamily)